MSERSQDGFTLMEMLVALAVLSLGLVALLNVTGENVRAASLVREDVVGGVVAQNQMVQAMLDGANLDYGTLSGTESMAGQDWTWERHVAPTGDDGLMRIEITVRQGPEGRDVARLTGFKEVAQ